MEPSPTVMRLRQNDAKMYMVFTVTELLGLLSIILVVVWCSEYLDGFAFDGNGKQFNWHPTLMVIGFLFLFGNSMVIYRVLKTVYN